MNLEAKGRLEMVSIQMQNGAEICHQTPHSWVLINTLIWVSNSPPNMASEVEHELRTKHIEKWEKRI